MLTCKCIIKSRNLSNHSFAIFSANKRIALWNAGPQLFLCICSCSKMSFIFSAILISSTAWKELQHIFTRIFPLSLSRLWGTLNVFRSTKTTTDRATEITKCLGQQCFPQTVHWDCLWSANWFMKYFLCIQSL